jgi:PIN domain nuclease of toxin-antitoxin system
MKLLLDTHALLWWLFDDPQLSPEARTAIADFDNTIFVSSASAWEIATKHRLGRLPEAAAVAKRLPTLLQRATFTPLPISVEHALAAGSLLGAHKDPFDRMLIAQARLEKLSVATIDKVFKDYGIAVVW